MEIKQGDVHSNKSLHRTLPSYKNYTSMVKLFLLVRDSAIHRSQLL